MRTTVARHEGSPVGQALESLLSATSCPRAWAKDVLSALTAVVLSTDVALLVRRDGTQSVYGTGGAAYVLQDATLADGERTRLITVPYSAGDDRTAAWSAGVWDDDTAGEYGDSSLVAAVAIIGATENGDVAGMGCSFDVPASRAASQRHIADLQVLWPALAASVKLRSVDADLARLPAALLASLPGAAAIYTNTGRCVQMNAELNGLLRRDRQANSLHRAFAVAAAMQTAGDERSGDAHSNPPLADVPDVRTTSGAYRIRRCSLPHVPGTPSGLVLIVVHPVGSTILDAGALRDRFRLTSREYDVAALLCRDHSNIEVAKSLRISESTARHYTERVLIKLGARTRAGVLGALLELDAAAPRLES